MAYKNIEDSRAYHRQYMKERRAMFIKHHLCSECGREDIFTIRGDRQCQKCKEQRYKHKIDLDVFALQDEELAIQEPQISRHERHIYNMCYRCGKPLYNSMTKWDCKKTHLCKDCYEQNLKTSKPKRRLEKPICRTERATEVYLKLKAKKECEKEAKFSQIHEKSKQCAT